MPDDAMFDITPTADVLAKHQVGASRTGAQSSSCSQCSDREMAILVVLKAFQQTTSTQGENIQRGLLLLLSAAFFYLCRDFYLFVIAQRHRVSVTECGLTAQGEQYC
jgi:hypothetical protein